MADKPAPTPIPRRAEKHISRRRRILLRVGAMALGCAIALVIAEMGLRLAGVGMPSIYAPDHHCGSRLQPSTTGVWNREGHGHFTINARGFRGPEVSATRPPDVFRIAVLGDSFIEALQVDEQATLCARLQRLLNAAESTPKHQYEVINCGVSGYGTAQELQMLRHHVLPLDPDAVLLAVYPENDIRNNLRSLEHDPARPYFTIGSDGELVLDTSFRTSVPYVTAASPYEHRKRWIVNRSRVLQVVQQAWQNRTGAARTQSEPPTTQAALQELVAQSVYAYAKPATDEHQQAWQITERLLGEIAGECQSRQIPLFVFTVSSPVQVHPDRRLRARIADAFGIEDLFYAERRIEQTCRQAGAPFCPLASKLQEIADNTGEHLHGFPDSGLGHGHWNDAGHLAAARLLADWLVQQQELATSPASE